MKRLNEDLNNIQDIMRKTIDDLIDRWERHQSGCAPSVVVSISADKIDQEITLSLWHNCDCAYVDMHVIDLQKMMLSWVIFDILNVPLVPPSRSCIQVTDYFVFSLRLHSSVQWIFCISHSVRITSSSLQYYRRHCRTIVNIFHHAAAAGTLLCVTHYNTGPQRRQTGRYVHSIIVKIYYSHFTTSHNSGEWTATFTDCAPCNPLTNGYVRVLTWQK